MKNLKKVMLLLVCVLAVGLFAGCGNSFDMSGYVKGLLDNSYKNDSTTFEAQKVGTAEQAAELYEQGIEAEVSATFAGAGVSEDMKNGYAETYKKMFSLVNYTVGEAKKQDDGSYEVTIEYQPLNVFGPAVEHYNANVEAVYNDLMDKAMSGDVSDEEIYDMLFACLKEGIDNALAAPTYGDKATATVKVSLKDKVWTPDEQDLNELERVLLDMDALDGMTSM